MYLAVSFVPVDMNSPIDLFQGWPSQDLLPNDLIRIATENVLTTPGLSTSCLNYGLDEGPESLRKELSIFLSQFYSSPWTDASRLTITSGASQALSCILQVYTDPSYTQNVYMVAPTYFLACRIFEDNGFTGRLRAVPEDPEGIDLKRLEELLEWSELSEHCSDKEPTKQPLLSQKHYKNVIYCVPTFSNPSGSVMTQCRRERLVRLAREHDALIITDDVYDFLHWNPGYKRKALAPRLIDIDQQIDGGPVSEFGNVVSNGSFSKILGPGLRTGWTESTSLFAEGLVDCGSTRSGGPPSHFVACIIADMLRTESLHKHLFDDLVGNLKKRYCAALGAINKYLVPRGVICCTSQYHVQGQNVSQQPSTNQGGYYIYIEFPNGMDAKKLSMQAEREWNVIIGSGEKFEVKGDEDSAPSRTTARLCIARESEDRLVDGIRKLGSLVHANQ